MNNISLHFTPTLFLIFYKKKISIKKIIPLFIALFFFFPHNAIPQEADIIILDDYESGMSPKWQEKKFKGSTHYTVVRKDTQTCIEAKSSGSASSLLYKTDYAPSDYPHLSWQWKVNGIIKNGDASTKAGDDFAARIYIVFPHVLFWKTTALNYIWANKMPIGSFTPNAYTANNMMIAVESGPQNTGRWITEKRNIYDDYIRAFGVAPPRVGAIAIMTDTDDTGEVAQAWYGKIRIIPKPQ